MKRVFHEISRGALTCILSSREAQGLVSDSYAGYTEGEKYVCHRQLDGCFLLPELTGARDASGYQM